MSFGESQCEGNLGTCIKNHMREGGYIPHRVSSRKAFKVI